MFRFCDAHNKDGRHCHRCGSLEKSATGNKQQKKENHAYLGSMQHALAILFAATAITV